MTRNSQRKSAFRKVGSKKIIMCKPIEDFTGKRFGRLIVITEAYRKNNESRWLCKCDCGKEKTTTSGSLKNGHTRSCGCLYRKKSVLGYEKLFRTWQAIKGRCRSRDRKYYYHKGIKVCQEWINSYQSFHNWAL